ncbi:MAG: hypothetical protein ACRCSO_04350 [Sphingomonas sp.]
MRGLALAMLLLCGGCSAQRSPPPATRFADLPVSGSLNDAKRAGFGDCFNFTAIDMRCRRHGVMLLGKGPFEAAVDLIGSDGSGGFDALVLWDDRDQEGVYPVTDALERQGWLQCMTAIDERGDQLIYTRPGSPVWIAMDLSYWGKRRLRILPEWNHHERRCTPGKERVGGAFKDAPGTSAAPRRAAGQ